MQRVCLWSPSEREENVNLSVVIFMESGSSAEYMKLNESGAGRLNISI